MTSSASPRRAAASAVSGRSADWMQGITAPASGANIDPPRPYSADEVAMAFSGAIDWLQPESRQSAWSLDPLLLQHFIDQCMQPSDSLCRVIRERTSKDWSVTQLVYWRMCGLYSGNAQQYFCLSSPTQPLNRVDYDFPSGLRFSTVNKPVAVQEREFLLADQLLPVAPIVSGATGESLSRAYFRALNNLVPHLQHESALTFTQKQITAFLTRPSQKDSPLQQALTVNTSTIAAVQGSTKQRLLDAGASSTQLEQASSAVDSVRHEQQRITLPAGIDSPLDTFHSTIAEYSKRKLEVQQQRWDGLMDSRLQQSDDAFEAHLRHLSYSAEASNFEVEALYLAAVMKGRMHQVANLCSYLDIQSVGELLGEAKAAGRAARSMMTDQSGFKYPVNFSPSNWAAALRSEFEPEDLLADPDVLAAQLAAAKSLLSRLLQEQKTLLGITSNANYERLSSEYDAARAAQVKANEDLSNAYAASTVDAIKTAVSIAMAVHSGGISALVDGSVSILSNAAVKAATAGKQMLDGWWGGSWKDDGSEPPTGEKLVTDLAAASAGVDAATGRLLAAGMQQAQAQLNLADQSSRDMATQLSHLGLEISDAQLRIKELEGKMQQSSIRAMDRLSAPARPDPVQQAKDALNTNNKYKQAVEELRRVSAEKQPVITEANDKKAAIIGKPENLRTEEEKKELAACDSTTSDALQAIADKQKALSALGSDPDIRPLLAAVEAAKAQVLKKHLPGAGIGSDAGTDGWSSVVMQHKTRVSSITTASSSQSSSGSGKGNVVVASLGSERLEEDGSLSASSADDTLELTIAFKSMKVGMQRPGWFAPELLRQSAQFHRVDDGAAFSSSEGGDFNILRHDPVLTAADSRLRSGDGLLPVYPTALILAKDVVIIAEGSESARRQFKKNSNGASSSVHGCCGFTLTSTTGRKGSEEGTHTVSEGSRTIIKIPGAQILGYLMQKTPPDRSTPLPADLNRLDPISSSLLY